LGTTFYIRGKEAQYVEAYQAQTILTKIKSIKNLYCSKNQMGEDHINLDSILLETTELGEKPDTKKVLNAKSLTRAENSKDLAKRPSLFKKRKANFGSAKRRVHNALQFNIMKIEGRDPKEYMEDSNMNIPNPRDTDQSEKNINDEEELGETHKKEINVNNKQSNRANLGNNLPPYAMGEAEVRIPIKDEIPEIIDPSVIKELKDRRNRAEINHYARVEDQNNNNETTVIPLTEDANSVDSNTRYLEVDTDERYTDGRLALSEDEKRIQDLLRKREIEEALSDIQDDISDNKDTSENLDNIGNMENTEFEEIYRKIAPQSLHKSNQSLTDQLKLKYPEPRLKKITPLNEKIEQTKKCIQSISRVVQRNKQEKQRANYLLDEVMTEKSALIKRVSQVE